MLALSAIMRVCEVKDMKDYPLENVICKGKLIQLMTKKRLPNCLMKAVSKKPYNLIDF